MIVKGYILKNRMPVGWCMCLSEACACVLTSKQVLKSLCDLWAGSATAWACSEPVSALWKPFCTMVLLYCLEHAAVWRVCSPRGYGKQQRGMNSVIPTILLFLFCHLHYTGKTREIGNLKKKIPVLSLPRGRTAKSEVSYLNVIGEM